MNAEPILEIAGLGKTYAGGAVALRPTDLTIAKGEIFALLGPNGAGKTTLIGCVCGLVRPSGGSVRAFGLDMARHWRTARARIGLVPQELQVDMFEHVGRSVAYSRALFGKPADPERIERLLKSLALWDKRGERIQALSGGMKRRVLIAKALAHDPELLFLDEPIAGVDVELRRDMWQLIARLREQGVTVILTTHYIEEAEEMADRVGVIDQGALKLVEEKHALMARLGRTEARITLAEPIGELPPDNYYLIEVQDVTLNKAFDLMITRDTSINLPDSMVPTDGKLHDMRWRVRVGAQTESGAFNPNSSERGWRTFQWQSR